MSQSSSFNNDRQSMNYSLFDSLAMDSPIAYQRNFSRFSKLADRSRTLFGGNNSSASFAAIDESPTLSQSNISADLHHQSMNITIQSPISTSKLINISSSNATIQYSQNNLDDQHITEDEMARLAIFESFFELNQKYLPPLDLQHSPSQHSTTNVFTMMDLFQQTCDDNLLVTQRLLENKNQHSEYQLNYLNKFCQLIRLERNIWCLLKVLLGDRCTATMITNNNHQRNLLAAANNNSGFGELNNQSIMDMEMEIEEDMRLRLNDSELVERAMEKNSMLREMQIIIDWLESMYEDEEEKSMEKMDFYSDGPAYWENTLHQLKISSKQQQQQRSSMFMTAASLGTGKNSRILCQEMDPDAPIRNGQPLHDLDKEDENRLFHHLFKLIRSGRLPEGKEIAERFGYFWLSAALEGWIFHNDRNYNEKSEQLNNEQNDQLMTSSSPNSRISIASQYSSTVKQLAPIEGNPYRDLWKLSSWKCSKMDGTNLYERAIFSTFSGNRSVLMPLCNKWMDKLWAYFKCSLDVHLENLLIDTNISKPDMQPRSNIELPDSYWDNRLTPDEIFRELETQFNLQTSSFITRLEEECYRAIVKDIILSNIDSLVDHLYEWSKTIQTNRESRTKMIADQISRSSWNKLRDMEEELMVKIIEPNLLRLFAHIVICLKELNLINIERHSILCVEILEIYIGFLIEYKLVELIAFYTSFLPETKQVRTFATLLETIDDESDRRLCLIIAKNAKLNLSAILSMVIENIRLNKTGYQLLNAKSIPFANFGHFQSDNMKNIDERSVVDESKSKIAKLLSNTVTEDDIRKINSLDWLLLDGDNPQYLELLWQANALIRNFLLEQKIDLAFETFNKLPSNIINESYNEWKLSLNFDYGFDIENVIREYLCHSSYFEANEAFKKWHHFLYTTKPREPTKPKTPINRIADRVLYEQRQKQFEQDMEIWRNQLNVQASNTTKKLLAFLCFPNGIWLDVVDSNVMQEIYMNQDRQTIDTNDIHSSRNQISIAEATAGEEAPSVLSTEIVIAGNDQQQQQQMHSEAVDDDDYNDNDDAQSLMTINSIGMCKEHELVIRQQLERKRNEWQNCRPGQMDGIRRIYIPQFCFLLHSVYRDSGDHQQCLRVADLVADENQRLHTTFTQENLSDFLALIRESAIKILDYKSDPFGCDSDNHQH
uniref:Nuclear pore complex protein n=1 Tax=Dermatophagoides pteronyssinus TaxID=6956 RepID=A0A6P6Y7G6_DERPT|nr:nuclear pore complex protein Nup107-like [Dermatophagoides pteronyssinus]